MVNAFKFVECVRCDHLYVAYAILSCISMHSHFQKPQVGFEELLPCPHQIVSLEHAIIPGDHYLMVNSTVSESLGLPPWTENQIDQGSGALERESEPGQLFDISVLCTAFKDLGILFNARHPIDPRLVDALQWNVKVSSRLCGTQQFA